MPPEAWLAIAHAGQTGAAGWQSALRLAGSASALVAASRQTLEDLGLTAETVARLKSPDPQRIERSRAWLADAAHALVPIDDSRYPSLLRETGAAPLALWVRGARTELLNAPQLAIVGSRNATRGGLATAEVFARHLGDQGLTITSGLAVGIDGASHRGALDSLGSTLAVLGSGIDTIYPPQHARLAADIESRGLIVSEYPPGTPPQRHRFPARNRIIAGLSCGVLVVEASRRSGSLITARFAADYGREVFAVPGSIHNPLARGCHWLIRRGATLVEDAPDVLAELAPLLQLTIENPDTTGTAEPPIAELDEGYTNLLELVGYDPTRIDVLVRESGLTTAEVSSMLLLLELDGLIEALPGGHYARIATRR